MSLSVDIQKAFPGFRLDAGLEAGDEVLALLGPSGSGKSVTLKCIAGIERPDSGRICVNGVPLYDSSKRINLKTRQRKTGLLFQSYALFPNMTVEGNLLAGVRQSSSRTDRRHAVAEMAERFHLSGLEKRYPHELSGGQQQRAALARLLLSGPEILLLDEPFSALDSHLRFQMEGELRELLRTYGKTSLLVSHDFGEVYRLSDRIAILRDGQVEAAGTTREVFDRPKTVTAAGITGCRNISPVRILDDTHALATDWGLVLQSCENFKSASHVGVRAERIVAGEAFPCFSCTVMDTVPSPGSLFVTLRKEDRPDALPFLAEFPESGGVPRRGDVIRVCIPPDAVLPLHE